MFLIDELFLHLISHCSCFTISWTYFIYKYFSSLIPLPLLFVPDECKEKWGVGGGGGFNQTVIYQALGDQEHQQNSNFFPLKNCSDINGTVY